ncbi:hypothetical protein ATANTOWER_022398 [Ataeniobius toweri]|uniref:Uncharacterized protein n=1 Tax=Ataeniobius toweri TaxID=208326 RepID=A0ABU7B2G9_9TELE|nr:hypothetical protein [Ataeniobius toweri]
MEFRRKFNLENSPLLPAPSNYFTTFSAPTNQLLVRIPLQPIIPQGFALKDLHTQNLLLFSRASTLLHPISTIRLQAPSNSLISSGLHSITSIRIPGGRLL